MNLEQLDDALNDIFENSDWEGFNEDESKIEECKTEVRKATKSQADDGD